MTREQFLNAASRLYDEMFPEQAQPALFPENDAESAPKKVNAPYKIRKEITRVSNIADHYGQPTPLMNDICKEIGIVTLKGKKGQMIKKADVDFLVLYIQRRYNNFNEEE